VTSSQTSLSSITENSQISAQLLQSNVFQPTIHSTDARFFPAPTASISSVAGIKTSSLSLPQAAVSQTTVDFTDTHKSTSTTKDISLSSNDTLHLFTVGNIPTKTTLEESNLLKSTAILNTAMITTNDNLSSFSSMLSTQHPFGSSQENTQSASLHLTIFTIYSTDVDPATNIADRVSPSPSANYYTSIEINTLTKTSRTSNIPPQALRNINIPIVTTTSHRMTLPTVFTHSQSTIIKSSTSSTDIDANADNNAESSFASTTQTLFSSFDGDTASTAELSDSQPTIYPTEVNTARVATNDILSASLSSSAQNIFIRPKTATTNDILMISSTLYPLHFDSAATKETAASSASTLMQSGSSESTSLQKTSESTRGNEYLSLPSSQSATMSLSSYKISSSVSSPETALRSSAITAVVTNTQTIAVSSVMPSIISSLSSSSTNRASSASANLGKLSLTTDSNLIFFT
jgi:trimeric autotransporter adhesin